MKNEENMVGLAKKPSTGTVYTPRKNAHGVAKRFNSPCRARKQLQTAFLQVAEMRKTRRKRQNELTFRPESDNDRRASCQQGQVSAPLRGPTAPHRPPRGFSLALWGNAAGQSA